MAFWNAIVNKMFVQRKSQPKRVIGKDISQSGIIQLYPKA